ncbi:MAG: class I SAM-dependent methyltransferase [Elusimicrobia bacterium]|nr:class I SAM-dependent methyltransferase [Elusimicrobiota bacterium]
MARFRQINRRLDGRFFHDGLYYQRYKDFIAEKLPHCRTVLNLGAGSGLVLYGSAIFANQDINGRLVVALDLELERLKVNPHPLKMTANAERLPFRSHSVDLIISDHVFEHLDNPGAILREACRALKPGGSLIFATPNKYYYACLIAAVTPMSFHKWVAGLLGNPAIEMDLYPTTYKINSIRDITRLCEESGFKIDKILTTMEAPGYTRFLPPPIHFLFILFHKLVQSVPFLKPLHSNIVGVITKS